MKKNLMIRKTLLYALMLAGPAVICHFWLGNVLARKAAESSNMTQELGRLAGLLGLYAILLQLMLVGRVSWIERVFGLDRLTIVHHINGIIAMPLLIAHPLLLAIGHGQMGGSGFIAQYRELLTWDFVIFASIGLALLCLVAFLSMDALRRRINYEVWYAVHLLVYLVIPLAFMHQIKTGNDLIDSPRLLIFWCGLYAFSYGNLVIFRLIKPLFLFSRHRFAIDRIERESDDVVSMYISGRTAGMGGL